MELNVIVLLCKYEIHPGSYVHISAVLREAMKGSQRDFSPIKDPCRLDLIKEGRRFGPPT